MPSRSPRGNTFTPIITLPSTERIYYDTDLTPDTKYTYRFITIDDAGDCASAALTAMSAAVQPATP